MTRRRFVVGAGMALVVSCGLGIVGCQKVLFPKKSTSSQF